MKIHKEGFVSILIAALVSAGISVLAYKFTSPVIAYTSMAICFIFFGFIVSFFRIPARSIQFDENGILAPADGKVVVIEQTTENEYFGDKRMQVSIFMSPLNVHVNLYPISGMIKYFKYHPGKFLVASLPKSATENERTTCVIQATNGKEILVRQVAGALARRIVWYVKDNTPVEQGNELGFIKFGSRVDLYLPLGTKIHVALNEKVQGKITKIASW
ncbi:MAG: hypothetical protein RIS47_1559 [Bacteroidota bacterium]|jgi:phosphatidylserine decarboxylase